MFTDDNLSYKGNLFGKSSGDSRRDADAVDAGGGGGGGGGVGVYQQWKHGVGGARTAPAGGPASGAHIAWESSDFLWNDELLSARPVAPPNCSVTADVRQVFDKGRERVVPRKTLNEFLEASHKNVWSENVEVDRGEGGGGREEAGGEDDGFAPLVFQDGSDELPSASEMMLQKYAAYSTAVGQDAGEDSATGSRKCRRSGASSGSLAAEVSVEFLTNHGAAAGQEEVDKRKQKVPRAWMRSRAYHSKVKKHFKCRIEGCLSTCESAYAARSLLCTVHIKALSVPVDGVASRFCLKCTRFHPVESFKGQNHSCTMSLTKAKVAKLMTLNSGDETAKSDGGDASVRRQLLASDDAASRGERRQQETSRTQTAVRQPANQSAVCQPASGETEADAPPVKRSRKSIVRGALAAAAAATTTDTADAASLSDGDVGGDGKEVHDKKLEDLRRGRFGDNVTVDNQNLALDSVFLGQVGQGIRSDITSDSQGDDHDDHGDNRGGAGGLGGGLDMLLKNYCYGGSASAHSIGETENPSFEAVRNAVNVAAHRWTRDQGARRPTLRDRLEDLDRFQSATEGIPQGAPPEGEYDIPGNGKRGGEDYLLAFEDIDDALIGWLDSAEQQRRRRISGSIAPGYGQEITTGCVISGAVDDVCGTHAATDTDTPVMISLWA